MKQIRRIQMAFQDFDLAEQVKGNHELWDINETVNLTSLLYRLKDLEKEVGRQGYGLDVGLRCLFLQFLYDRSDRQMERDLRFNIAYKWFCGFTAFGSFPCRSDTLDRCCESIS